VLSSAPSRNGLFPETELFNKREYGFNRAQLAWYQIDPLFFKTNSDVKLEHQSNLLVYRVKEQDIFPNKESQNGVRTEISTLDLAFYPKERGPYNYDTEPSKYSAGLDGDGFLLNLKHVGVELCVNLVPTILKQPMLNT
jgi:cell surface protein SprA